MMTYSKYRDSGNSRCRFRTAAEVTAGILVLLSLHGWMQYRDARDALEDEKYQSMILASNLASCMNGGAVYDKASDTAHFCGKVTSVKLGVKNLPFAP
jgi:hypothetical protein